MNKEDIQEYLGKKAKVVLKTGMKYSGKVLALTDTVLVVDDWKEGEQKIDIHTVGTIGECGRRK
ncbi:MAG: hypothetical protein ABII03_00750 [Nanoarchaeota archaeon]